VALAEVLARLYRLAPRGARLGLESMRDACAGEDDPQDALCTVHVAGTNGKGSVAASIESIARAAGLRTGLYTSPHLGRFAERIRLDGEPVDDVVLEGALAHVLDRQPALTFFEVATLAAFGVFREARVDLVVLEVGLGGRFDATNVVARPRVTAITTVSYDHMELLGESIESIAFEKAGILKPGVPVVTGRLARAAAAVVEARAREVAAAPVWRVGEELTTERRGEHLVIRASLGPLDRSIVTVPSLQGAHQDDNAAIAAGVAWMLRLPSSGTSALPIEDEAIARGLADVRWPGRLESIEVHEGPYAGRWLLDGAHNEEGARALGAALEACAGEPRHRVLVFGAMADKAWRAMVNELSPRFATRVYVEPSAEGRRAAAAPQLAAMDAGGQLAGDVVDAMRRGREAAGRSGTVVVAGSLYLVGEVRARLLGTARDPQVGL
jgi:dihydrofolate synthase/folylpolyglutamate synthase